MRKLDVYLYGTNPDHTKPFRIAGGAECAFVGDIDDYSAYGVTFAPICAGWVRMLARMVGELDIYVERTMHQGTDELVIKIRPTHPNRTPAAGAARPDENATQITPPEVRWVAPGNEEVN